MNELAREKDPDEKNEEATLDVSSIVTLINEMVSALGTSHRLKSGTDITNLIERLRMLRDQIDAVVTEETPVDTTSNEEDVNVSTEFRAIVRHGGGSFDW
jgi:hypothetical protein